jgi:hypothetical protein
MILNNPDPPPAAPKKGPDPKARAAKPAPPK